MRPKKYNPAFLGEDELVESFVVRHHELDTVLEVVRANTGATNQHLLVIAPRGFGKSMLVRRAAVAVRRDPGLTAAWFPILFAEESYEVRTHGELWLEALLHLHDATGDPRWDAVRRSLRSETDEGRLVRGALGALLDFADERGVRLLLVIENLDQLLGAGQLSESEAWDLRKILLSEPRIMLLGTAVRRFPGVETPDQAMFDLFRRIEMDPLDARECDVMWTRLTGERLGIRRAKALRILSGGNPRLLTILGSFSHGRGLEPILADLDSFIDDHTEYFRQNIEALQGDQRRVFLALAELWKPSPARAVAEEARLPVSQTSAVLGRLADHGRVVIARTQGKNHYYQVSERLYNIYYLMRRRGAAEARVRALVDFIRHLYEPARLPEMLGTIASEACGRGEGSRREHMLVLGHFLETSQRDAETYAEILRRLPGEILRAPDLRPAAKKAMFSVAHADAQRSFDDLVARTGTDSHRLHHVGDLVLTVASPDLWQRALGLLELHDSADHLCWLRARLLGAVRGPDVALTYVRERLPDPDDAENLPLQALQALGMRLAAVGLTQEAIELFSVPAIAGRMEPMVVALRRRLGEVVDAPIEMVEIADDLNARIDALIAAGDVWRTDPLALVLADEIEQPTHTDPA